MKRPRITMLKPRFATLDTRTAKPLPKQVDPHYNSPEHAAWALTVKRRAGWRCEYVENGQRCIASTARGDRMHADHIQSRKSRPDLALDLSNGRCACTSHNTRSGLEDRAQFMRS